MALPEQIRKQTEAVQELYKQLNTDDSAGGNTDSQVSEPTVSEQSADENLGPNTAAPAPANEQKPGADNVPEETIVQKYKTLQGMYNAEVPRLHHQNKELQQRIQNMEQLLASISSSSTPASAPATATVDRLVTDKDVEEYGESLDVMRKVTREELASVAQRIAAIETALTQMKTQVVPQVQAVAQRQQMTAEQQFWADLSAGVPNFKQVNDNPDFQTWLIAADPLTGITRQTYLEDAQRALDSRRVVNIFRTWLESTGQAAVAHSTGNTPSSELEKQVSPGRSRSTGTPASTNQAKNYSPQDIQKFFNDVRAGKYKGKEQERARIERDIFSAQREGRIVTNA